MLETLKGKLNPKVYKDLEIFVLNETNFSAPQKEKFVKLLENIHVSAKENLYASILPEGGTRNWG